MQLKCKKSKEFTTGSYHWGQAFTEGKLYTINKVIDQKVEVITHYQEYWNDNKIVAKSGQFLRNGTLSKEELESALSGYNQALNNFKSKRYTTVLTLPFFEINSELSGKETFCVLAHIEISYRFKISLSPSGEIPFRQTINMVDEYFDTLQFKREERLVSLGIK